jgi:peptidoglycan/xylan/chitin deacetylase (PgdA/CDA1 family)
MKAALRKWLLRGLVAVGGQPRPGEIAALTYHSLDDSGSRVSCPPLHFCRQVEWLASTGYRTLTASDAAALLSGERRSGRHVVLTFDDGFRSVRETAFPVLAEFGFVATVFCAAGYIGKQSNWEEMRGAPAMSMMSWDDLAFLGEHGWEVGGHGVTHARLPALQPGSMEEDIAQGRRIVEERTGSSVNSFAYPFGDFDRRCVEAVAACGFTSAWTMEPHVNRVGADLFSLGRFNCDRIRSDTPEIAALAVQTYLSGRYGCYSLLTGRAVRIRDRGKRAGRWR